MNIVFENGDTLRGDMVLDITHRTSCVPMPVTVEATVRVDSETDNFLVDGSVFSLGVGGVKYRIVHVESNKGLGSIQGNRPYAARKFIAIMDACKEVAYIQNRAVIVDGSTFGAVYRSLGSSIKATKDVALKHFACLAGTYATEQIAKQLFEEGVLMYWDGKGLCFERCSDALKKEPILNINEDHTESEFSGFKVKHQVPSAYSPNDTGDIDKGSKAKKINGKAYAARTSKMQMSNMQEFFVRRRTLTSEYTPQFNAGQVVVVSGTRHVILTAAHTFVNNNAGSAMRGGSRFWLGTLNN